MAKWWLQWLRGLLQSLLDWVNHTLAKSPRQQASSLLSREVHVPTPIVTAGSAFILFALLLAQVGWDLPKVAALAGLIALLTVFFVIYLNIDLPQFLNDDEAVFLIGLSMVLG